MTKERSRCFIKYRQAYLPDQIAATRRKLAGLRREALRLAMPELVEADDAAEQAMRAAEQQQERSHVS
jgi:hypothetical protein